MVSNTRNVTVLIKLNITGKWCNVVRQTLKQIFPDLKQKKKNLILIHSSISIARANTR